MRGSAEFRPPATNDDGKLDIAYTTMGSLFVLRGNGAGGPERNSPGRRADLCDQRRYQRRDGNGADFLGIARIVLRDSSGQGLAAAVVLRVRQDNSQVYEPMVRFDPTQNRFVAIPIDLSDGSEQVFLILFGTGLRNRSALANVRAKIGSENAQVSYAGSQGLLAGLDQVNLRLLPTLRGSGNISVELVMDGRAANHVMINVK